MPGAYIFEIHRSLLSVYIFPPLIVLFLYLSSPLIFFLFSVFNCFLSFSSVLSFFSFSFFHCPILLFLLHRQFLCFIRCTRTYVSVVDEIRMIAHVCMVLLSVLLLSSSISLSLPLPLFLSPFPLLFISSISVRASVRRCCCCCCPSRE